MSAQDDNSLGAGSPAQAQGQAQERLTGPFPSGQRFDVLNHQPCLPQDYGCLQEQGSLNGNEARSEPGPEMTERPRGVAPAQTGQEVQDLSMATNATTPDTNLRNDTSIVGSAAIAIGSGVDDSGVSKCSSNTHCDLMDEDKDNGSSSNNDSGSPQEERREPQDCAICLDIIQLSHHAKATLACRHEFHLSCISYLHKDQPFMSLEPDEDIKPASSSPATTSTTSARSSRATTTSAPRQQRHPFSPHHDHLDNTQHPVSTLHEHPTSGTVLSMMPSLFETSLGHGLTAGTIRTSSDGICLKTSTWLLLYAMPFTVALMFLAFVLGKVETMWSKISCLIGAAICYMVCWALVVAVMDPDHEARDLSERLNQIQANELSRQGQQQQVQQEQDPQQLSTEEGSLTSNTASTISLRQRHVQSGDEIVQGSGSPTQSLLAPLYPDAGLWPLSLPVWIRNRYALDLQNRVQELADILDDLPDMMAEW
ncbi:hypothetical protein BG011_003201 [Mortierella polycephala]|uniref:RING-type domain-containing protein n=1 Tax=Mortierella polycephala TaxID=41804 RepID=A0A9P6U4B5_9FUNG|nr:hypothetical protein BG011_003201 [Mortierella polycephala]